MKARARPLLTSVRLQAKKMMMNRGERRPPKFSFCSARIRLGPTPRFLARQREEVMIDVEKATMKRIKSVLFRSL